LTAPARSDALASACWPASRRLTPQAHETNDCRHGCRIKGRFGMTERAAVFVDEAEIS